MYSHESSKKIKYKNVTCDDYKHVCLLRTLKYQIYKYNLIRLFLYNLKYIQTTIVLDF